MSLLHLLNGNTSVKYAERWISHLDKFFDMIIKQSSSSPSEYPRSYTFLLELLGAKLAFILFMLLRLWFRVGPAGFRGVGALTRLIGEITNKRHVQEICSR
ncbi:hypothetical protein FRC03_001681 [Tulasnella sp. 419]|nr:hypothetical protein FRC03_001681 [Tulasnella sp. 419]